MSDDIIKRLRAERDEHARWRSDLADKLHDAESQISAAWTALRRAGIQSEETVAEAIALLHAENERLRIEIGGLRSQLLGFRVETGEGSFTQNLSAAIHASEAIDAARKEK